MKHLIKILIIFYCLSTLSFFRPFDSVPDEIAKILAYGSMFLIFALSIMTKTTTNPTKRFAPQIGLLMLFIFISCFMPLFAYVDQTFAQTLTATIPFFSYGLYLSLRKFEIERNFIYGLVFSIAILATLAHIVNHITFPIITFGIAQEEFDMERGGLRLAIIGFTYIVMSFFIAIGEWTRTRKFWWWIPILVFAAAIFSSYTRQHILVCSIVGMWMLLGNIGIIKRLAIIAAMTALLLYLIPQIPIFNQMMDLTVEQYEQNEYTTNENVRITAARYYGYEHFETFANRIFGNGVPSFHSNWGLEFDTHAEMEHLHPYDVGWIGMNWYFGALAVFCMFSVCLSIIFKTKKSNTSFISGYFIWLLITGFSCGAPIYQFEIIVTVLAICLVESGTTIIQRRKHREIITQWGDQFHWERIQRRVRKE